MGSKVLVSIVNMGYVDSDSVLTLPEAASNVGSTPWENGSWIMNGDMLRKAGMERLEVNLLILELEG